MPTPLTGCAGPTSVVFDPSLIEYDFGPAHPLNPIRVELTMELARTLGVFDRAPIVGAAAATPDALLRVHTPQLIEAVTKAGTDRGYVDPHYGLGTADNPTFPGIHEAAATVVGASLEAARRVWTGESLHSVNIAGGLHHAMPGTASGFCIYNDVALAIDWLLQAGATRVAYVDVDVHHGDGVEAVFWDDPRVLTISLHETGRTLFPGTGFSDDIGGPEALGYAVNVPLPPETTDAGWLRAFDAVVPPLLRRFQPEVIVTQHGCDSHRLDPLAHLGLTVDGQRAAYSLLHDLAHELSGGRWVVTGGGGYALVDVVPRAWAHLLGIAAGVPIDPRQPTPEEWQSYVVERCGRSGPTVMTDGPLAPWEPWDGEVDLRSPLDRSVVATRAAVFPHHGLVV